MYFLVILQLKEDLRISIEYLNKFVIVADASLKDSIKALVDICQDCISIPPYELPKLGNQFKDAFESIVGDLLVYFCTRSLEDVDSPQFWDMRMYI